jgi:NADPH:quinone reductase-like Zn-dependent oxidoreductase
VKALVQERYGNADVLELRDVEPPVPGEGEVLLQVHAAGIDYGVWHLMTGLPYLLRLGAGLRAPRRAVRGADVSGVVVSVGEGVASPRPGDEVFGVCSGAFAEYAVARAGKLVAKPVGVPFEQAAAVPTSAVTALQALRDQARLQPGQRLLVLGAGGGVGTFAVQLGKALGAHVTGVCSTGKVELVRSIGADEVVDYTAQDPCDGRERYDVVLDIAGNRPLRVLRRALTPRGTLVIVGGEGGGRWFSGLGRQLRALLLSPLLRQRLRVFVAVVKGEDLAALRPFLEGGQVVPQVGEVHALGGAPDALRALEAGTVRGKAVVAVVPTGVSGTPSLGA